jgi:hypothetical protein
MELREDRVIEFLDAIFIELLTQWDIRRSNELGRHRGFFYVSFWMTYGGEWRT